MSAQVAATRSADGIRLRVDPVACTGVALCARLAPDAIDLDRWGYPRTATGPLEPTRRDAAVRAIRACPRQALWLEPDDRGAG